MSFSRRGSAAVLLVLAGMVARTAGASTESPSEDVPQGVAQAQKEEAPKKSDPKPGQVKYRASQEVNFEQLIIDGQLQRPDLSVVTGTSSKSRFGILRIRENFVDRLATEAGEESQ